MSGPERPDWDLFHQPPEPPTGPQTDVSSFPRGYHAWVAFKSSRRGQVVWRWWENRALMLAAAPDPRISARTMLAQAREKYRVKINDHWSPLLADDLVARHPHLEAFIERRVRKSTENTP